MHAPVTVIAEAGVNHNGSLDAALELVHVAASCGANVVKFQSFRADRLVTRAAPKAAYQTAATGSQSQFDMLKALELSDEDHIALSQACGAAGIEFMSTPFDIHSLDFLCNTINVRSIKLGSGDLTNGPLLLAAAQSGRPVILSTGMGTLGDVEAALGVLAFGLSRPNACPTGRADFTAALGHPTAWELLTHNVTLLHCTTEYPAPLNSVNLQAMVTLREAFGLQVGFSDHTLGTHIPLAAVAMGATVIEKHFTLDRSLPGPDHKASLTPNELAEMIAKIRDVEAALGTGRKVPAAAELPNRDIARRSLVAARDIRAGEKFSHDNLDVKRPGTGISPLLYWDQLGHVATRNYLAHEIIEP